MSWILPTNHIEILFLKNLAKRWSFSLHTDIFLGAQFYLGQIVYQQLRTHFASSAQLSAQDNFSKSLSAQGLKPNCCRAIFAEVVGSRSPTSENRKKKKNLSTKRARVRNYCINLSNKTTATEIVSGDFVTKHVDGIQRDWLLSFNSMHSWS